MKEFTTWFFKSKLTVGMWIIFLTVAIAVAYWYFKDIKIFPNDWWSLFIVLALIAIPFYKTRQDWKIRKAPKTNQG